MRYFGYASVFYNMTTYNTVITPKSAYVAVDTNKTYPVYREHDSSKVIGWAKMKVNKVGIYVVIESDERLDKAALSIGYMFNRIDWTNKGANWKGEFGSIEIEEVSVVDNPADKKAHIYALE